MVELTSSLAQSEILEDTPVNLSGDSTEMSAERRDITTTLAAAATMDTTALDKLASFKQEKDRHDATLTNVSEMFLRDEIAWQKGLQIVEGVDRIAESFLSGEGSSPEGVQFLKGYSELREELQNEKRHDALESQALDNIANLALEHPELSDLASLMLKDKDIGDASDYFRDQLERSLIIQREAAKAAENFSNRSLFSKFFQVMAVFVPLQDLTSANELPGQEGFTLSGSGPQATAEYLKSVDRATFDAVYPEVFKRINEQSGFFTDNPLLIERNIDKLLGSSKLSQNIDDTLDIIDMVSLLPIGVGSRLTKTALLRLTGSRNAAIDMTKDSIQKLKTGDDGAAVQSTEEAFDNAFPKVMQFTDEGETSLGPAAIKALDEQERTIKDLADTLSGESPVPRGTPVENSEAFKAAIRETQERYGRAAVVDFDTSQEIVQGIPFRNGIMKLTYKLGRKDGLGYADKRHALAMATRSGVLIPDDKASLAASKVLNKAKANEDKVRKATQKLVDKARAEGKSDEDILKLFDTQDKAVEATKKADEAYGKALESDFQHKVENKARIEQDPESKLWYVKAEMDVSEKNFVTLPKAEIADGTAIGAAIRSPANILPHIMQARAVASDYSVSTISRMIKPMVKSLSGLGRKRREAIEAVWVRGRDEEGKWFNELEFSSHFRQLNGRAPTEKEVAGYATLKNLNDFEYYLRNHAMYTKSVSDGYITGSFDHPNLSFGRQNVKEITRIEDLRSTIMYDVDADKIFSGRDISAIDMESRLKSGFELFALRTPEMIEGVPVGHILAKKGQMKQEPLVYRQLNYSAGGHRMYAGTIYIQQGMLGFILDRAGKSQQYVMNPKTHAVVKTMGEANDYIKGLEESRLAYVDYKAGRMPFENADQVLRRNGFEDGVEEFETALKEGKIVEDQPFEAIRDGEFPSIYERVLKEDGSIDMRVINEGMPSWLEDHGKLYYGKKGKALPGPQDKLAQTIDPFTAANRAVENAMDTAAYMNYRINAVQRWLNEFGSMLPKNSGMSDNQNFWQSPLTNITNLETARKAEVSRRALKNQMKHPTQFGRELKEGIARFADWVEPVVGNKGAAWILDMQSKDPIGAWKAIAFDPKLGLFDPSQLIVQTQTAAAMMTVEPLNAPRFFNDAVHMRRAAINTNEEILNSAAKMSTMEAEEFKVMMRQLRGSGASDPSGEMMMLNHNPTVFLSSPMAMLDKIRAKGRVLFYESERLNRIYAWRMAWNRMRKDKSVEELNTIESRAELSRMTSQFTLNMESASAAAWQKGVLSIPTQFLSYQARFIENILPMLSKRPDGRPVQWTEFEKFKLVTGQLFLYGALGVPAGREVVEYMKEKLGIEVEEDSIFQNAIYRMAVGGIYEAILYTATSGEVDVAPGARMAILGRNAEELAKALMGDDVGASSFLDILGGAGASVAQDLGSDAVNGIMKIYRAASSETVGVTEVLPDVLIDMADNISSFKRAHQAIHLLKYGEWISTETGKAMSKGTPLESIAALLGIQPRDYVEADYLRSLMDNQSDFIKEQAKMVKKIQLEAWRALEAGDEATYDYKMRLIMVMTQHLGDLRPKIHRAGSNLGDTRTLIQLMKNNAVRALGPVQGATVNAPASNTGE